MIASYVHLEPIFKYNLFIEAFLILLSMSDIEYAFFTVCVCKKSKQGSLPLTLHCLIEDTCLLFGRTAFFHYAFNCTLHWWSHERPVCPLLHPVFWLVAAICYSLFIYQDKDENQSLCLFLCVLKQTCGERINSKYIWCNTRAWFVNFR